MFVTRVLDVAILMLLAAVLLMPRPDARVSPALRPCDSRTVTGCLTGEQKERVAELQSHLLGSPGDADGAFELANLFLDAKRPDWALSTVAVVLEKKPDDYRLHQVRAIAHIERLDPDPARAAAARALFLCETPPAGTRPCPDDAHARVALLEQTLRSLRGVDMRKQPYLAKERNFENLHPTWIPRPRAGDKPGPAPVPQKP